MIKVNSNMYGGSQWRRDACLGSIDLHKFERKIQVNVTINSNLLLDQAKFDHFYNFFLDS